MTHGVILLQETKSFAHSTPHTGQDSLTPGAIKSIFKSINNGTLVMCHIMPVMPWCTSKGHYMTQRRLDFQMRELALIPFQALNQHQPTYSIEPKGIRFVTQIWKMINKLRRWAGISRIKMGRLWSSDSVLSQDAFDESYQILILSILVHRSYRTGNFYRNNLNIQTSSYGSYTM